MMRVAAVFFIALGLILLLQWRGNAYQAEWSLNTDEPAHYVTGLLVHDYIKEGFPHHARAFADNYYAHYPKVAIGHWPPVFYIVEGAWMLLLGTSRASLLVLMAVISAAVLAITYVINIRYFPAWVAFSSTLVLAAVPGFQQFSRSVMPDMLVALFTLLALLVLARHLEHPQWRTGVLFGILATATILTKGTGLILAPLPILGAWQLRRSHLFRQWAFWAPAILVLAVCLPWFVLAPDAMHQSAALLGGLRFRWYRPFDSLYYWITTLGIVAAPLVAFGVLRAIRRYGRTDALWALLLWLPIAVIGLRMFIGDWSMQYLVATLAPMMPFFCEGFEWFSQIWIPHRTLARVSSVLLLVIACVANVNRLPAKPHLGFDAAAHFILASPQFRDSPLLIVSNAEGEGAFIAEVASGEQRPGHWIERGSKVLATSGFMGGGYHSRFASASDLMQFFEANRNLVLVLDTSEGLPEHAELVKRMLGEYRDRWQILATFPRRPEANLGSISTIEVLRPVAQRAG